MPCDVCGRDNCRISYTCAVMRAERSIEREKQAAAERKQQKPKKRLTLAERTALAMHTE